MSVPLILLVFASRPVIPPLAIALVVCICAATTFLLVRMATAALWYAVVIIGCALLPVVPLPPLPAAPLGVALLVGLISCAFESACDQKAFNCWILLFHP